MALHGATFVAPLPGTPPVGMSAMDGRLVMGGLFGVTPQLVSGGGIVQSGSTMQFTMGQSVFQLPDVTNAAATAFLPTDSTILTPAAGPGTGSRVDLFCVPFKNYENGDGISQSQPFIVAGTAGAPGVAPAVPAGSYRYASVLVPTSAAAATACTVTIYGNTTVAPVALKTPTKVTLAAVTTASQWQEAVEQSGGVKSVWNGSAWVRGGVTVGTVAASVNYSVGASTSLVISRDGIVTFNFYVNRTSGTISLNEQMGTLPAAFCPNISDSVVSGGMGFPGVTAAAMRVYTNGNILYVGPAGNTTFIGSVTFPAVI